MNGPALLSAACLSCATIVKSGELFCPDCGRYALELVRRCPQCGGFIEQPNGDELGCRFCRDKKFAFDAAASPFIYAGAVAKAVTTMKYGPIYRSAVAMGRFLGTHIPDPMRIADRVIFPPMSRTALFLRGFNQAAVLADEVARRCVMLLDTQLLKKVKRTKQQAELSLDERKRNLAGAFALTRQVAGKRFLLIDDVATTLTTANEIATLLKNNGADKVFVLTFARKSLHFD